MKIGYDTSVAATSVKRGPKRATNRGRRKQMEALRDHICELGPPEPKRSKSAHVERVARVKPIERPISFNDEMLRALLTGRKNQTRRLVTGSSDRCPFGSPGDVLWVRERWAEIRHNKYAYAADGPVPKIRFRPTFHMPRVASRISLVITDVGKQRLQAISTSDARAEGFDVESTDLSPRRWFAALWDRICVEPGTRWADNPLVWVVRFERV